MICVEIVGTGYTEDGRMYGMVNDLKCVLFTEEQIAQCVKRLALKVEADYEGKDLVCVCILKGGFVFMADLVRAIRIPLALDFMATSSYGASTKSGGVVRILKDLDKDITGKHVLLVEDIVDSGLTLSYLKEYLKQRGAASLKICALLDKPERRKVDLQADYIGFTTPDAFLVGYGLDYAEKYRNLPMIGVLKPEVYENA